MANPLRKTMVYLGLADEEFDYEDGVQAQPAPAALPAQQHAAGRAPVTPLRRFSRGRPKMTNPPR